MSTSTITKGLEGVVAASSGVCYIDGDAGVLAYRGIDIHELAEKSTFEETCYLLWFGRLPKAAELADLKQKLGAERKVDPAIYDMMRRVPKTATPMEVLRTAVSALSFYDSEAEKIDHDANVRKSIRLTSQIAMIVAGYDRIRKGKNIVDPDPTISHAANFLLQLNGEKPSPTAEKALDVALILHADHELNASTFAARVTAATLSDMHSAITSAIGALKGPLHGGANEAVMRMLFEDRQKRRGPGGACEEHAGQQEKDFRLWPSRLSHGRPAGHAPARRCRAIWASRQIPSGMKCRPRLSSTLRMTSISTPTWISTPLPLIPRLAWTWTCSRPCLPFPASAAGQRM